MPIEVRELIIKATITREGAAGQTAGSSGNSNVSPREEIVNTCVEKVMEILKVKDGR